MSKGGRGKCEGEWKKWEQERRVIGRERDRKILREGEQ